ncbi:hypothetical protein EYF80_013277 [Liparis tanakae]|uniref:Uncharacterized protein n=1 Tax=Liparis tanakae TaxID=230148 RepID=A0A4Z2IGJ0_9TELE|nr:hypothetical protein EYF80_013277 [Liparis tanakae]
MAGDVIANKAASVTAAAEGEDVEHVAVSNHRRLHALRLVTPLRCRLREPCLLRNGGVAAEAACFTALRGARNSTSCAAHNPILSSFWGNES